MKIHFFYTGVYLSLIYKKILAASFCCMLITRVFSPSETKARSLKNSMAATRPADWYSGDIHVHRNCGEGSIFISADSLQKMMDVNDLDVISVLADMGNGEVQGSKTDLPKVTGANATQSNTRRIVHWDAEWHWDATYSAFDHQALGGHLVLLGLQQAKQIWEESPYKILDWAKQQHAVTGFAHLQYLADTIQKILNCCIPVDLPVEAALGTIDFVSEDVYSVRTSSGAYNSEAAMNAYYKLLNCGFRLGLAAGTDFPCNDKEPLGNLLTYVRVKDTLNYQKWIDGIKKGNTVVSRAGNTEFLDLTIKDDFKPGDDIPINKKTKLPVRVTWSSNTETAGTIEIIVNGKVIARKEGNCTPGEPMIFSTDVDLSESSWIAARRMNTREHVTHTAPVYITMKSKPVRAAKKDAEYYVQWIDNILNKIQTGGEWHHYYANDFETVRRRYQKARAIFSKISNESQ